VSCRVFTAHCSLLSNVPSRANAKRSAVVVRAQNALEAERRALAAVDRQLFDVLHGAYSQATGGRRAVAPWLDVAAHAAALAKLRTARSLSVGAAHGDAADSRAAHDVAWRRQRALSRLREQHYEVFLLQCERRDAAELDEMNAFGRKAATHRIGN